MTLVKVNGSPVRKAYNSFLDEWLNEWTNFGKDDNTVPYNNVPVNIHETNEAYHLELNAPGLKKEDIKIKVENGLLTISYEQKEETKSDDYKTVRREFRYAGFKRSFTLSEKIDSDHIRGKYEDGILKVLVPKKAEAQAVTKEIEIQ
ncbi:MAG TPA: Hsp20/alpha crystallin family protein [Agriterribacter sp.]|nr:Hsp20/alpha crystallin family protein [Agriterribacter sp.]HRQ51587.1 Hsp20/alpha crystallin family protein [Agriterribacter sp.]